MDEITYYHVELPQHDVLLAEGLPANPTSIPVTARISEQRPGDADVPKLLISMVGHRSPLGSIWLRAAGRLWSRA